MSLIEKKYQLFISSTFTDLIAARQEVIKVFLNMYHIPIGMEMFSADNAEQWETIQETIDDSDYYILLVGHRYGSIAKDGISFTEKEYDYAVKKGIPVYAFIRDRDVATLPAERENDSSVTDQLDAFIGKVKLNSTVEFWTSPAELGQKVSIAMEKAFRRRPQIGWVKADKAASPEILEEIVTLSRLNRELTDKVAKFEEAQLRKPDLRLLLNGQETIDIKLSNKSYQEKLITKASYQYPEELYHEAYKFYTQSTVDRYNAWFDVSQDIINEYNKTIQVIERAKENRIELSVTIQNKGTAKANDIRVTLEFRNVIIQPKDKGLPVIGYPEGAPKHPTTIAMDAYNRTLTRPIPKDNYSFGINPDLGKFTGKLLSAPYHVDVETGQGKDQVNIRLKDLLHTKAYTAEEADNLYLLPIVEGKATIKATVMCEEFTEPVVYDIPLVIDKA